METLEISRVTDTTAAFSITDRRFGSTDCTGTAQGYPNTFDGDPFTRP